MFRLGYFLLIFLHHSLAYSQKLCGDLRNFVKDGEEMVFYAFAYIEPLYSRQLRLTDVFEIRYNVDSARNLNDAITNHLAVEFEQYLRGTRPDGTYTKNGFAWRWQNRGVVRCPNLEFVQAARAEMIREYLAKNAYDDKREQFREKGLTYRRKTDRQEFQNVVYRKRELIYPDKTFQDSTNYQNYNNYPYYGHFSPYNYKKKVSPKVSVEDISEEEAEEMHATDEEDDWKLEKEAIKRRKVIEEVDFIFDYPMNQYYKGKTKVTVTPL